MSLNPYAAPFVPAYQDELRTHEETQTKQCHRKNGVMKQKHRPCSPQQRRRGRCQIGEPQWQRRNRYGGRKRRNRKGRELQAAPEGEGGEADSALSLKEDFFPPLGVATSSSLSSETAVGAWSQIARQGQVAEASRLELEAERHSQLQRNMTLLSLRGSITLATTEKSLTEESPVPDEDVDEVDHDANHSLARKARPLDMRKMRDKWWQAVKEKRVRDVQEALRRQYDAQCKETDSEEESFSDDFESESEAHSYSEKIDGEAALSEEEYPLHRAIIDDDSQAVRSLLYQQAQSTEITKTFFEPASRRQLGLAVSTGKLLSDDNFTPLHLAVYLDRPHLLNILLGDVVLVKAAEAMDTTPLMLASELAFDGCIKTLLSRGGSALTAKDKTSGETAVHYACRAGAPVSTLKTLLTWLGNGQMPKPLSSQNFKGQTPLHLACEAGHTHLVDGFLHICSSSLLSRLLQIRDDQQQTPLLAAVAAESSECVMALLMSQANHCVGRSGRPLNSAKPNEVPCPLSWAVSFGSLEMVHLLLEFSGTGSEGCSLDKALQAAVRSEADNRIEIVRILVDAGANPCFAETGIMSDSPATAFSIAATKGDTLILGQLLDSYNHILRERQLARRQDPKLQKQPSTYFRSIEEAENLQLEGALNDALVIAMFLSWIDQTISGCTEASVLLLKKGTSLSISGFSRLRQSLLLKKLIPADEKLTREESYVYETEYVHYGNPKLDKQMEFGFYDRTSLSFWSAQLLLLPWMKDLNDVHCAWILAERRMRGHSHVSSNAFETITLTAQGSHFQVHSWIVSQKSGKLAAAIRFITMNRSEGDKHSLEIDTGLSPMFCQWLLEHIYTGSVVSDLGPNADEHLLELSLVAQTFLCPSLVQECEMRLLASNAELCFCWSCCLAVRQIEENAAQCLYRVRGPSKVMTANTPLDALALSGQMRDTGTEEYRIKFWPSLLYPSSSDISPTHAWNHYDSNARILSIPFSAVRETALTCIALDFSEIVKSESFIFQVRSMIDESESNQPVLSQEAEAQVMLLQLCLDELECSDFSRIETMNSSKTALEAGSGLSIGRLVKVS